MGFIVLFAYTVFSFFQWQHMRWANTMTRESINSNNSGLQQTIDKMTWQIQVTQEIAKQALTQAQETTRLANDTHDLAESSKVQSIATKQIATGTAGQLTTMQQQLELTNRPWLKISDFQIDSGLTFQDTRHFGIKDHDFAPQIAFSAQIANVGQSTATNIFLVPELYVPLWTNFDIEAEEKRFCDIAEKGFQDRAGVNARGRVIFPGDHVRDGGAISGNVNSSNIQYLSDQKKAVIVPVIIACVDYQFQASPVHHQARFIYEVFRNDNRNRFFELMVDAPKESIFGIHPEEYDYAY